MPTRDLSNKRIQFWMGPASSLASWLYATEAELAAMIMSAPAIRFDGLDFGFQASDQIDDRSLDDDATATIRSFMQAGGGMPLYFPKVTDETSVLRQIFDLVKVRGTELAIVTRVGFKDRRAAGEAGDNISIVHAMTDGYTPDTEGTGGYAYIQNMLPKGDMQPWTIVADSPAVAVTIGGGAISGAPGALFLRSAAYLGNDITPRAIWTSSDPTIATVDNRGLVELIDTGSCTITAGFPGGTTSTTIAVTVS